MAVRWRGLRAAWQDAPLVLLIITVPQAAGVPESFRGSAASQVPRVAGTGLLSVVLIAVILVTAEAVLARRAAARGSRPQPRPRWQYAVAAAGWLGVTGGLALAGPHWAGPGLAVRSLGALGLWTGAYGLVLTGRAACWGRPRALLW